MGSGRIRRYRLWFSTACAIAMAAAILTVWWNGYDTPTTALVAALCLTCAFAAFGCSIALRYYASITRGILRWMDVVWVMSSCISLALTLVQVFAMPAQQRHTEIIADIERARPQLNQAVDAFQASCKDIQCGWAFRIKRSVEENRLRDDELHEFCPSPSAQPLCAQLAYFAERITALTSFNEEQTRVELSRWPLLGFVILALMVRFPKSVVEILLSTDNSDLIVKNPSAETEPTWRQELQSYWAVLSIWFGKSHP